MIGRGWLGRALTVSGLGLVLATVTGVFLMTLRTSVRLTTPPGYAHPLHEQRTNGGAIMDGAALVGTDPQERFGLPFQTVSFPTTDGSTLRGWLVPGSGDGPDSQASIGIVAAHARGGDRRGYFDHLPSFHARGFTTLLFDYREHGLSDGTGRGMSLGQREAEDIQAAVHFLKDVQGLRKVGVIGHSLGGSSVILAAARDPQIDAVIAESSIARFETYVGDMTAQWVEQRRVPSLRPLWQGWWPRLVVDLSARRLQLDGVAAPVDVIAQIAPRPLLLIHGTNDDVVAPSHSETLLASAGTPSELWLVPGVDHGTPYPAFPPEYFGRVTAFFSTALR